MAEAIGELPPPAGRLLFAAGPLGDGWQVVQVWQSRDKLDAFNRTVLAPALAEVGAAGFPAPPAVTDFETTELAVVAGAVTESTAPLRDGS